MFKVFNMGTRIEFYTDEKVAAKIIEIAQSFNIDADVIGRVEVSDDTEMKVTVSYLGEIMCTK
jgi:phosphoribosylformylglycinamidine cyclo-ligase